MNNLGDSSWFDCHNCETSMEIKDAMEDQIKNPSHYIADDGTNVKDVIKSFKLGFNLGNVIKYTLRAGKKGDKATDLKKAIEYLNFELQELQEENGKPL